MNGSPIIAADLRRRRLAASPGGERLNKIDMVADAMQTLATTTPAELSAFVASKYAVEIEPRMMPIFRASVEQREALARARSAAKELIARAAVETG
jgi:hypothetical protein